MLELGQQIFDAVDPVRIGLEERISPAFLKKAFNVLVHCFLRRSRYPERVLPPPDLPPAERHRLDQFINALGCYPALEGRHAGIGEGRRRGMRRPEK
jgi:hypothetical protein